MGVAVLSGKRSCTVALLALLLGPPLDAEQVGYAARVIRGASVRKVGADWGPLLQTHPVDRDSQVRTDRASEALLLFQPHGFLYLGERTLTIVSRWLDEARGCDLPKVVVMTGDLRIFHRSSGQGGGIEARCLEVKFEAPGTKGTAKGTDLELRASPRLGTLVVVHQGEAHVEPDHGDAVDLKAGEWLLVRPNGTVAVPPTPVDSSFGPLDDSPLLDCCDFRIGPPEVFLP
jgi:hypothetical protein